MKKARSWNIIQMIDWGEKYFSGKGVDSPKKTMEWMIGELLSYDRLQLYTRFDRPFTETELEKLREMVKRRAEGEPLQYIMGHWDFYGLDVKCDRRALIPRPETEDMAHEIVTRYKRRKLAPKKVLDIGTGTGALGLVIAREFKEAEVIGVDVSSEAVELSRFNGVRNKCENFTAHRADILATDPKGEYDLVVSNPPYVSKEDYGEVQREIREHEPAIAVTDGADGLTFYRRLVTIFENNVSNEGEMWMEFGKDQEEAVAEMFSKAGGKTELFMDSQKVYRYVRVGK